MTMKGTGTSHGAATIVNAIANGKGAAFGLDLKTEATVELTEGDGMTIIMDGLPGESTSLVERCVLGVLERAGGGKRYHAVVRTSSQIPVSRGLKSSSAAANAVVLATLDALNVEMELEDAVRIGTRAAVEAGVSAYVVDGLRKERVKPILDMAISRFNAFARLKRELQDVRGELEDRKVIEQAKGILMRTRSMDEAAAYALLRKTAMNQNRKISDVAQSLITAAKLLEP